MADYQGMMEGIGGPVDMDPYSLKGIDPTLDACCQREVSQSSGCLLFQLDSFSILTMFVVAVITRLNLIANTTPWKVHCADTM
jgi:hypothetical protein